MEDLFEHMETLPSIVVGVIKKYAAMIDDSADYQTCEKFLDELQPLGYTFDYGLDGIPSNLKLILDCK